MDTGRLLTLAGAAVAIVQVVLGTRLSSLPTMAIVETHAALAIVLLALAIACTRYSREPAVKRIMVSNVALILTNGALGIAFVLGLIGGEALSLLHLLIGLGILSNFSAAYGLLSK